MASDSTSNDPAKKDPALPSPAENYDEGPYGLRGKDTPPLINMFGGYAIIFGVLILLPLLVFFIVRFVIL